MKSSDLASPATQAPALLGPEVALVPFHSEQSELSERAVVSPVAIGALHCEAAASLRFLFASGLVRPNPVLAMHALCAVLHSHFSGLALQHVGYGCRHPWLNSQKEASARQRQTQQNIPRPGCLWFSCVTSRTTCAV